MLSLQKIGFSGKKNYEREREKRTKRRAKNGAERKKSSHVEKISLGLIGLEGELAKALDVVNKSCKRCNAVLVTINFCAKCVPSTEFSL